MSALFSDEQLMIRDMARKFAEAQLLPHSEAWDRDSHFPVDVIKQAAELGFAGIYVSEEVGGSALTRTDAAMIFEQLSYGDVSTAAFISIHNMASWMIDTFGSDAQRQAWVPRLTRMELIASYCLTEPGAGSDAASLKTRAVKDGDDYVISGTKQFISGAGTSDVYVLMARTSDDGAKGVSAFIIEKDTPGLSFGANERKMGWKSQPTRQVMLDGVRVPAANRIGEEGHGFRFAMAGLDGGRLNIAACALGGAQAALEATLIYMGERKAFGKSIDQFQALQFRLADMEVKLQTARIFLRHAAGLLDARAPEATKFCAMAKLYVTDVAFDVANGCLQLHGGYGYLADYGIEKIVRDLRVHQILEGTNEIMRLIISRQMLADRA